MNTWKGKKKWLFNTLYVHSKKGDDVHQVQNIFYIYWLDIIHALYIN